MRDDLAALVSNRVSNLPQGFNIHCLSGWSGYAQCNNRWAEREEKKKKEEKKLKRICEKAVRQSLLKDDRQPFNLD